MKKILVSLFAASFLALGASTAFAQFKNVASDIPAPPIAARSFLLFDASSGQVLASQAASERFEPASLTKLMTAYLVFDALKNNKLTLTQALPVSTHAWKAEGSRMFIDPKQTPTVEQLIRGTIIQSGNDSSIALGDAIAGAEELVAQLMHNNAQQLSIENNHVMY